MEDSTLLKISLIISITGIFTLLFILEFSEVKPFQIKDITKKQLENQIKIQGEITSIKETPGLYILNVNDLTETITVIIFKEDPLNIKKGMYIEVTGEVQEYKDELEIIADKIILK